jgi:hypothetical protein
MEEKKFTKKDFINESGLEFKDLSDELFRVYEFPDMKITIEEPLLLNVSASGGHRVFDAQGNSNYIPAGWRRLYWRVKDNKSHFAF